MLFPSPALPPLLSALLAAGGWADSMAGLIGLAIIVVLVWQWWRSRRELADELEEQAQLLAEAQAKADQALEQMLVRTKESQAKSELLATLSREVRAHLNGIIGSADLLLDNPLTPLQRENLTTLRASAEAMHQSLNDVLEFSSIETGQIKIATGPFDLRQPLVEVVEHLSPMAALKALELVLIVAPDVPLRYLGDAARLRQVLLNLASNSVKFTASGRVVLRVELSAGSAPPSQQGATWLHFSVTDTSAGIPEEMLGTIFERFAQSDPSSPRKFGGSGLELAIAKRLVELMGGRIGARSLPESGSEFWVVLPLTAETPAMPPPPAAAPLPAGLHVVVLDDVAAARLAASAMLVRVGVDHDSTDTVAKAAALLRDAQEAGARELALLVDESVAREEQRELRKLIAQDAALGRTRIVLASREPELAAAAGQDFPVAAVVRKPLLRADPLLDALFGKPVAGRPSPSRPPFEAAGEARPPAKREPRVLIVDDDEISRSVTAQLLARLGCVVERALGGAESIEKTNRTAFDLILMDCQMPEMDGFEATAKIRAAKGKEAPPIVALTANTTAADREKCSAVGMCDFVDKPVRKSDLARVIRRWVPTEAGSAR